tara:strand:+ start:3650 stop:4132 length:483 start_codon:yes stop_codon:yes gene_type:complete
LQVDASTGGWITAIDRALVFVIAIEKSPRAASGRTLIIVRTGLIVIAALGVVDVQAVSGRTIAAVVRTLIFVLAVYEVHVGAGTCSITKLIDGAGVFVVTGGVVGCKFTGSSSAVARIVGAGIPVVTGEVIAHTVPESIAAVVLGTGFPIVAARVCARIF